MARVRTSPPIPPQTPQQPDQDVEPLIRMAQVATNLLLVLTTRARSSHHPSDVEQQADQLIGTLRKQLSHASPDPATLIPLLQAALDCADQLTRITLRRTTGRPARRLGWRIVHPFSRPSPVNTRALARSLHREIDRRRAALKRLDKQYAATSDRRHLLATHPVMFLVAFVGFAALAFYILSTVV